jgi:putative ABC transport system substrate-binding protein
MISRRAFIGGLATLSASGLTAARAKAPGEKVRVAILSASSSSSHLASLWFVEAMRDLGWLEGSNIVYDRAYGEGDETRLPELAAKLLARRPDLVYVQTHPEARAVLEKTRTIPIVFGAANNPHPGLVKSLARPGGNVTGIANIGWELGGRRMQLLREAIPGMTRVGVLASAIRRTSSAEYKLIVEAAGGEVHVFPSYVKEGSDVDAAFAALRKHRIEAILVTHLAIFRRERSRILDLAARQRIPVMGFRRDMAEEGALMSYGALSSEQVRRSAHIVDKILRGTKPAEIPVEQPTRFELLVNLRTARTLGITISQSILVQAESVIE